MAKIQRNTQKIFAGKGTNDPIAVFGSMKTGNPIYTDNIEDLQSTAYENGWADAIVADEAPFLEEMNGVQYGFSKQLAYLFQEGIPEYDAGTTYYKGSIIKALNTDNKAVLYYSLVDDNLNNPLTDNTKWEEITFNTSGGGGGLEVCDIGMSLYVDETKGLRRYLNGQIVAINDNTQGFLDRLKQITTLYPSLLTTEENWQAAKTLSVFGQVGKFVFNYATDGTTVESVRLPRVVNVQGVFDLQNLGLTVDAALPNITGTFGFVGADQSRPYDSGASGVFSVTNTAGAGRRLSSSTNTGTYVNYWNFNASKSSSVYKNGQTTVQQEAIQYPYFIQIATGQETEVNIVNDIELNNPYTLFDSKYADKPLYNASWLVSNGTYYTKAVYVTAYEGLVVEHNTEVTAGTTVTLPSGTSYTKRGLSVKLSTAEDITDYDFVLNTADETFRLPLKNHTADDGNSILTLYFYVGETVQNANLINAGRLAEQIADPSRGYLIESYQNGTSWYRKYSDGWCEQGGQSIASTVGSTTLAVINLLIPYRDTNYTIVGSKGEADGAVVGLNCPINQTTSSFKWSVGYVSALTRPLSWMTAGYIV